MDLCEFIDILKAKPWTYRLKVKNDPLSDYWNHWLICPVTEYIEGENQGPYPLRSIEWIDVNPYESRKVGRLMPVKIFDHSDEVIANLRKHGISFVSTDGVIRIYM